MSLLKDPPPFFPPGFIFNAGVCLFSSLQNSQSFFLQAPLFSSLSLSLLFSGTTSSPLFLRNFEHAEDEWSVVF